MSIIITHIKQLAGLQEPGKSVLKGAELGMLHTIDNAWLSIRDGLIEDYGPMSELPAGKALSYAKEINASGKTLLPAWCDSHSHIVYADSREGEFVDRIKGLSYEEIARKGGGILNSAKKVQAMSEEELYDKAWVRLEEVRAKGTGAIEIKSGYGLTVDAELKMLRVIRKLKEHSPLNIKATFLGAHAFPIEYKENHQGYMRLMIDEMLPRIAGEGLAEYVDAFCEFGFFSTEETAQILEAGIRHGLKPKIHANQLNFSGGIQVGVKYNAVSVDHLECVGEEELEALKNSDTIGTILPSAAFFLGIHYQPARKMIDAGLPLALATDYNPGTSPSGSIPFILSLACTQLKMTPEEAINACTLNGAYAMELGDSLGSVTKGKTANLIITKAISSYAFIPYAFGSDCIDRVILNGNFS